jgi:hypothetical protein
VTQALSDLQLCKQPIRLLPTPVAVPDLLEYGPVLGEIGRMAATAGSARDVPPGQVHLIVAEVERIVLRRGAPGRSRPFGMMRW